MTNTQQMMTQVKCLFDEVYTKGNVSVMDEMFAKHFKLHDSSSPHHDSLDAYKQLEKTYGKAFPTKKAKIDDMFSFENKVVVRWTTQGMHKGTLSDILATNKEFKISGITIFQFDSSGKISEMWQSWDRLGLMEQLGEIQPSVALHY